MNLTAAIETTTALAAITGDDVKWTAQKNEEDGQTIKGITDIVTLTPDALRQMADVLQDEDQVLVIDRSGAKARLTLEAA